MKICYLTDVVNQNLVDELIEMGHEVLCLDDYYAISTLNDSEINQINVFFLNVEINAASLKSIPGCRDYDDSKGLPTLYFLNNYLFHNYKKLQNKIILFSPFIEKFNKYSAQNDLKKIVWIDLNGNYNKEIINMFNAIEQFDEPKRNILIIDSDKNIKNEIKRYNSNYNLIYISNTDIAINLSKYIESSLILFGLDNPTTDNCFENINKIKGHQKLKDIPLIVMTSDWDNIEDENKCFIYGVDDFIPKQFDRTSLNARLKMCIELYKLRNESINVSSTDYLTKVYTRMFLDQSLKDEWTYFDDKIYHSISLLMIDVDYFKKYNDTYGHAEGDKVLKMVAQAIRETLRSDYHRQRDIVGRYGGEEFVAILPNADAENAEKIAKRLVESIRNIKIEHKKTKIKEKIVTISIGIATALNPTPEITSIDLLIDNADKMLYKAKKVGRNWYMSKNNEMNNKGFLLQWFRKNR